MAEDLNVGTDDAALMVSSTASSEGSSDNVFPEDPSDRGNRHVSQVFAWQQPKAPPQKRSVRGGNSGPVAKIRATPGIRQIP